MRVFVFLPDVCSICFPSRRSVFDMFNFLASKHREPPDYRPQEEDEEEGQLRTPRSDNLFLYLTQNIVPVELFFK